MKDFREQLFEVSEKLGIPNVEKEEPKTNNQAYQNKDKGNRHDNYRGKSNSSYQGNNSQGKKFSQYENKYRNNNASPKSNSSSQGNSKLQEATSTYNFVPFPSKWVSRYGSLNELPKHNQLEQHLLSGSISYSLQAMTPIIVGKGENKVKEHTFFKNHYGYAIPGSSIRGLIRRHVQILGMGNYRDDIQDKHYMYRGFASAYAPLREQYNRHLGISAKRNMPNQPIERIPANLQSGVIVCTGKDEYKIYPSHRDEKGKQIYSLSEIKVRELLPNMNEANFMYANSNSPKYKMENDKRKLDKQALKSNFQFKPYQQKIEFDLAPEQATIIKAQLKTNHSQKALKFAGYILTGQRINEKLSHYIIHDRDEHAGGFKLSKDLIENYKYDLTWKRLSLDFYKLPKMNESKPVFFTVNNVTQEVTQFGFTPYFRITYKHSVHDGIPSQFRYGNKLDYEKGLFGFINLQLNENKKVSYKSRLSFEDLNLVGNATMGEERQYILGQPKASAYLMYLNQAKAMSENIIHTYNDDEFEIRGMKKHWLQDEAAPSSVGNGNEKVMVTVKPLQKGSIFSGKIHFSNITEDELGLLLWSLTLKEDSKLQLGFAKPYGYGKLQLIADSVKVNVDQLSKKYGQQFMFASSYQEQVSPQKYIDKYKQYMLQVNQVDIENEAHILRFFEMTKYEPSKQKVKYMDIKSFKNKVLPTVEQIVAETKAKQQNGEAK